MTKSLHYKIYFLPIYLNLFNSIEYVELIFNKLLKIFCIRTNDLILAAV